jgi:hypothetical protein
MPVTAPNEPRKLLSFYSMIHSLNGKTCEFTVIGVLIFDDQGNYNSHRLTDLSRAIRRGDYPEDGDTEWLRGYIESFTSIGVLEKSADSVGHAMGTIQFTRVSGALLAPEDLVNLIWDKRIIE